MKNAFFTELQQYIKYENFCPCGRESRRCAITTIRLRTEVKFFYGTMAEESVYHDDHPDLLHDRIWAGIALYRILLSGNGHGDGSETGSGGQSGQYSSCSGYGHSISDLGMLSDRYGRKSMLVRACTFAGILMILMGLVDSVLPFLLLRLLQGFLQEL